MKKHIFLMMFMAQSHEMGCKQTWLKSGVPKDLKKKAARKLKLLFENLLFVAHLGATWGC
jgi:hypothetical protein